MDEKLLLSIIVFQIVFSGLYSSYVGSFCEVSLPEPPSLILDFINIQEMINNTSSNMSLTYVDGNGTDITEEITGNAVAGAPVGITGRSVTITGSTTTVQEATEQDFWTGILNFFVTIRDLAVAFVDGIITISEVTISLLTFPIRVIFYLISLFAGMIMPQGCISTIPSIIYAVVEIPLMIITFVMIYPTASDIVTKIIQSLPFT